MDDYGQICNLLYRYAELVNLGEFDAVGELFRFGRVQVEGNPTAYVGSQEIAAMYRESTNVPSDGPDTLLYTTNIQVEVDGDSAASRSYFLAVQRRESGLVPVVGGRYRDSLERLEGVWTFKERKMTVDLLGDLGNHLNVPIENYFPGGTPGTS
jgi:SnoaL-like domain